MSVPYKNTVTLDLKKWYGLTSSIRVLMVILLGATVAAQASKSIRANEYELKAAFVYRLMSFVDWDQHSPTHPVVVGFAGEGPMPEALSKLLRGQHVGTLTIDVREVRSPGELRKCDVLMVSFDNDTRTRETLAHVKDAPVLTIGEGEAFVKQGGIVALVPRDNTFQLAVNLRAAERAHVKLSSKLLAVAKLMGE